MKKQITALGLLVSSTIAFGAILNAIRHSHFFMGNIGLAIIAIVLTGIGFGWLATIGVETV